MGDAEFNIEDQPGFISSNRRPLYSIYSTYKYYRCVQIEEIKRAKKGDLEGEAAEKAEKKWTRLCASRDEVQSIVDALTGELSDLEGLQS